LNVFHSQYVVILLYTNIVKLMTSYHHNFNNILYPISGLTSPDDYYKGLPIMKITSIKGVLNGLAESSRSSQSLKIDPNSSGFHKIIR